MIQVVELHPYQVAEYQGQQMECIHMAMALSNYELKVYTNKKIVWEGTHVDGSKIKIKLVFPKNMGENYLIVGKIMVDGDWVEVIEMETFVLALAQDFIMCQKCLYTLGDIE